MTLTDASSRDAIMKYLERFDRPGFYGNVTLTYVAGRVTLVETKQTLKPEAVQAIISQEETPRSKYDTNRQER